MDSENGISTRSGPKPFDKNEYRLKTFQVSLNLLTHILIGIIVGVALTFACRGGLPLNTTSLHIVLCVIGYQLLMAQAILSLAPHNSWSAHLKMIDKRRAHWILQILGSVLAIAGSFIKILDKAVHWNTLHGQFALVALVFTVASLFNGLTSLYAYEFRKFIPAKLSKLTHICFGVVGFVAASISLCYGMDKVSFKTWTGEATGNTLIAFVGIFTAVIIIAPMLNFFSKFKRN
uniref:ascorbate ferrireductase (transmembrane) n=1 Tax=Heliothis virescens TaxID=7102 RepID=A0A2A4JQ72_HELVI